MTKRYFGLLVLALLVSALLSLSASASPDGLEKVAIGKGFIQTALDYPFAVLMPDYSLGQINNELLAGSLAGLIGTAIVFVVIYLIIKFLFFSRPQANNQKI